MKYVALLISLLIIGCGDNRHHSNINVPQQQVCVETMDHQVWEYSYVYGWQLRLKTVCVRYVWQ